MSGAERRLGCAEQVGPARRGGGPLRRSSALRDGGPPQRSSASRDGRPRQRSSALSDLRRLLALAAAPRARAAVALGLGAVTILFGVGLMAAAGYLIARASERPAVLSLTVAIVAVRFFGIARPLARYGERLASHAVALRTLGRVRVRVWERLEPLAPVQLAPYRDGDLLARMAADVDALQDLHLRGVGPPLVALAAGALTVAVAAAVLPAAGLVLAGGLVAAAVLAPAVTVGTASRATRRQAAARGEAAAELVELLTAAPELVATGAGDAALARLQRADRALTRRVRRAAFAGGAGDAVGLLVTGATVAGVLAVATQAAARGTLDPVLVAMLGLLTLAAFEGVAALPAAARDLSVALGAGRRVLELTDRVPAVTDPPDPVTPPRWPFAIALEDVTARYPGAADPALRAVRLRLEPGRRVALVGPSGAGKTTVVNLLLRFLDPEHGRVTFGGIDARRLRQDDVRRMIAVAGQDAHLLAATIRDNVRCGVPDASDQEIRAALRRARIWDWVASLPAGWDTVVGECGAALSGGQRQRIVLARALLVDAPLLVLDEPTAHLDAATALALVSDVLQAAGDRSVLLVTHRPEGLELVDEIVALG